MIRKIIKIHNIGRFINLNANKEWNGLLEQCSVVYGENGSGKTTLSIILKSLKGEENNIPQKKSFGQSEDSKVEILDEGNDFIEYSNDKWTKNLSNIEIFDTHFIEDYVFSGSHLLEKNRAKLFKLILDEKWFDIRGELGIRYEKMKIAKSNRKKAKKEFDKIKDSLTEEEIRVKEDELNLMLSELDRLHKAKQEWGKKLREYEKDIFSNFRTQVNRYLRYFNPTLKIGNIYLDDKSREEETPKIGYSLRVQNKEVYYTNRPELTSIKFTLSEGDKNSLALSFFLANLARQTNLRDKIIIFDDPISSFDYGRRNTTITLLKSIRNRCKQIIILTHDINFAKDIWRIFSRKNTSFLKIVSTSKESTIINHKIEEETLGGIFKDLLILKKYLSNSSADESEKRHAIRCMRPVLEGLLKIKYFGEIRPDEWLGGIIEKIETSSGNSDLSKLKPLVEELSEVNTYSKIYHHNDPHAEYNTVINDAELRMNIENVLALIQKL